eukprot:3928908-Pleurochrysis_carterae.AAC.2
MRARASKNGEKWGRGREGESQRGRGRARKRERERERGSVHINTTKKPPICEKDEGPRGLGANPESLGLTLSTTLSKNVNFSFKWRDTRRGSEGELGREGEGGRGHGRGRECPPPPLPLSLSHSPTLSRSLALSLAPRRACRTCSRACR